MTYYIDGYTNGSNPSRKGGGYTILEESGALVLKQELGGYITNNEAEVRGLMKAVGMAGEGDTICTDSQVAQTWLNNGKAVPRLDLDFQLSVARALVRGKKLSICWVPRHRNLAGVFNEKQP